MWSASRCASRPMRRRRLRSVAEPAARTMTSRMRAGFPSGWVFPFMWSICAPSFGDRVIGNFVSEYLAGRTPNPCVMCNREIKFDRLWSRARALDADFVATGHYARISRDDAGRYHLLRAADSTKDQSYFLFTLGQAELSRTLFPLGAMTKIEVRARARALGLANADKPESQEICFVPDGDYARFVERLAPERLDSRGPYHRRRTGNTLADHAGIHRFTVGQRRGLGIAARRTSICQRDQARQRRGRRRQSFSAELARSYRARCGSRRSILL